MKLKKTYVAKKHVLAYQANARFSHGPSLKFSTVKKMLDPARIANLLVDRVTERQDPDC